MRMGATHFLMKRLPKVATEMALHVLAHNITRVMNIICAADCGDESVRRRRDRGLASPARSLRPPWGRRTSDSDASHGQVGARRAIPAASRLTRALSRNQDPERTFGPGDCCYPK
jgi:hypothetical protein